MTGFVETNLKSPVGNIILLHYAGIHDTYLSCGKLAVFFSTHYVILHPQVAYRPGLNFPQKSEMGGGTTTFGVTVGFDGDPHHFWKSDPWRISKDRVLEGSYQYQNQFTHASY